MVPGDGNVSSTVGDVQGVLTRCLALYPELKDAEVLSVWAGSRYTALLTPPLFFSSLSFFFFSLVHARLVCVKIEYLYLYVTNFMFTQLNFVHF